MPTKRTPIKRPGRLTVTPEAVDAFRRLEALREACTCPPIDWAGNHWERRLCTACDAWWAVYATLHDALGMPPHRWPCFEYPDDSCPYPEGSFAALEWKRGRDDHPEKLELYHELAAACRVSP